MLSVVLPQYKVFQKAAGIAAMSKVIFVIFVLGMLGSCASAPGDIIDIDGLTVSARDVSKQNIHRIYIATTRAASDNPATMFTRERGELKFAHIDVFIPPTHEIGKIERADTLPPDPRKNFVALNSKVLPSKSRFISALNMGLANLPLDERNGLLFVHGYNTSFVSAIFLLAQFVNDTNYKGIPILFTWPSSGRSTDYLYDLNSALASRDELLETIRAIGQSNIRTGDILAHSMGTILTVEAVRQAALEGSFKGRKSRKLRSIVLASPDIDVNLFAKQIKHLPVESYEFFTVISRDDKALKLSKFLSGGVSRVGAADVETLSNLGVTVVDLTDAKSTNGTHSKFSGTPEVVQALDRAINNGNSHPLANVRVTRGRPGKGLFGLLK